jgi:hypothetical protein
VVAITPVLTTLASIIALLAAAAAVRAFRAIKTQTRLVIQEGMALWAHISWTALENRHLWRQETRYGLDFVAA